MPFPILVVAVAILASLARGGRFRRIPTADLQGGRLLLAGLVLQVFVDVAAARDWVTGSPSYLLLLASQLLVVGWTVTNRYRPGIPLIGLGLALNAIVIAANGAMPVDPDAIARLGIDGAQVRPGKHVLLTEATRLPWLADILALPPIRTIISVGDIVLAAGLVPLVHHLMTYRPATERRGGRRGRL
ncbi:MAG TPA: DUF5317 domain-containing protein [Nitriliruptorales bacterium]